MPQAQFPLKELEERKNGHKAIFKGYERLKRQDGKGHYWVAYVTVLAGKAPVDRPRHVFLTGWDATWFERNRPEVGSELRVEARRVPGAGGKWRWHVAGDLLWSLQ